MKKFHKRAAVFLTAATLAGLPAGAFFYSSPGSLTVWADNVEVESLEESSPEDVDFSDGSEVEIHADPVEQAQEDAGNDVTETPEVGITFTEPEGWQTDTATVKIQVEDTKNTGAFSIAKVEARLSENGGWSDITGNMEVSISSNCSVYVRVTDQNGNTYEQNRYIECFDKTKPTIIAAAKNGILIVQGVDAESGIAALYVNGNEFTELTNNTLNVRLQKADTSYEYFTLQAKDKAGNMSEIYKVGNPYYENPDAVKENTEVSGTEQNAASLPADGTASKPTSATATVTEHQTTNETATAPTEPENTGNETDTEADTGRVQGENSASGMTTGTVEDKGGKEFYTIKTKSDKVFYLIVDKDKTDENVYLLTEVGENIRKDISDKVREMGATIIKGKGRTHYGIATCVCYLAEAVLNQRLTIAPVSTMFQGEYGIEDVCLSVPSIIGVNGVEKRLEERWAEEEFLAFRQAAEKMRNVLKTL